MATSTDRRLPGPTRLRAVLHSCWDNIVGPRVIRCWQNYGGDEDVSSKPPPFPISAQLQATRYILDGELCRDVPPDAPPELKIHLVGGLFSSDAGPGVPAAPARAANPGECLLMMSAVFTVASPSPTRCFLALVAAESDMEQAVAQGSWAESDLAEAANRLRSGAGMGMEELVAKRSLRWSHLGFGPGVFPPARPTSPNPTEGVTKPSRGPASLLSSLTALAIRGSTSSASDASVDVDGNAEGGGGAAVGDGGSMSPVERALSPVGTPTMASMSMPNSGVGTPGSPATVSAPDSPHLVAFECVLPTLVSRFEALYASSLEYRFDETLWAVCPPSGGPPLPVLVHSHLTTHSCTLVVSPSARTANCVLSTLAAMGTGLELGRAVPGAGRFGLGETGLVDDTAFDAAHARLPFVPGLQLQAIHPHNTPSDETILCSPWPLTVIECGRTITDPCKVRRCRLFHEWVAVGGKSDHLWDVAAGDQVGRGNSSNTQAHAPSMYDTDGMGDSSDPFARGFARGFGRGASPASGAADTSTQGGVNPPPTLLMPPPRQLSATACQLVNETHLLPPPLRPQFLRDKARERMRRALAVTRYIAEAEAGDPNIHSQTLRSRIRQVLGLHGPELDVVLAEAEVLQPGSYVKVRGDLAALDEKIISFLEQF